MTFRFILLKFQRQVSECFVLYECYCAYTLYKFFFSNTQCLYSIDPLTLEGHVMQLKTRLAIKGSRHIIRNSPKQNKGRPCNQNKPQNDPTPPLIPIPCQSNKQFVSKQHHLYTHSHLPSITQPWPHTLHYNPPLPHPLVEQKNHPPN